MLRITGLKGTMLHCNGCKMVSMYKMKDVKVDGISEKKEDIRKTKSINVKKAVR
jgi:hypothetical protein